MEGANDIAESTFSLTTIYCTDSHNYDSEWYLETIILCHALS